ncbi:UNVERIFIED_CONTAM: hypothetical protein FKN15_034716 [Acipenser sinensis]
MLFSLERTVLCDALPVRIVSSVSEVRLPFTKQPLRILQKTGIPMNCSIRLQLSLYIKQVSGISETGKISPVVMPMIWFAESGYIDGPILDTFYNNLVLLPSVLDYMQYVFIALGGLMLVAAVFLGICDKRVLQYHQPLQYKDWEQTMNVPAATSRIIPGYPQICSYGAATGGVSQLGLLEMKN